MPGVDSDSVDMMVNFGKAKTFTILYQSTGNSNPGEVWVKFGKTENNQDSTRKRLRLPLLRAVLIVRL